MSSSDVGTDGGGVSGWLSALLFGSPRQQQDRSRSNGVEEQKQLTVNVLVRRVRELEKELEKEQLKNKSWEVHLKMCPLLLQQNADNLFELPGGAQPQERAAVKEEREVALARQVEQLQLEKKVMLQTEPQRFATAVEKAMQRAKRGIGSSTDDKNEEGEEEEEQDDDDDVDVLHQQFRLLEERDDQIKRLQQQLVDMDKCVVFLQAELERHVLPSSS